MNAGADRPAAAPPAEPAPVRHRVRVALSAPQAFELFTADLARWWPMATHSCSGDKAARVHFEPRVGGSVRERGGDGREHVWGRITRWDAPRAFAMTWHPGRGEDEATVLEVSFVPAGEGACEVQVLHSGWERRDAAAREGYERGWPQVLASLAGAAEAAGAAPAGR